MVYSPREDSYLLQKWVEKYSPGMRVADIGTGSGVQAITAAKNNAVKVVGVDIDEKSIQEAESNALKKDVLVDFRRGYLFDSFNSDELFDLIVFNPPYLPRDERVGDNPEVCGGIKGNELTMEFLKRAKEHLVYTGRILLILSTVSNVFETLSYAESISYSYKILDELSVGFETLYCVEFVKK